MAASPRSRLPLVAAIVVVLVAVAVGGFSCHARHLRRTADARRRSRGQRRVGRRDSLDGSWAVVPGTDEPTEAGYRIEEVFAAGAREATAKGRTDDVSGTLTVADGSVPEGSFTAT